MKIIFLNRFFAPDESATSQMLSDLAFGLASRGHSIHVLCSRQRYDDPDARLPSFDHLHNVTVHRIWTSRFGRGRLVGRAVDYLTFYISSAIALLALVKRGDTVVAKTDPPLISVIALAAAAVKRANLINWMQDIFPEVASLLGANPLPRALDAWLRRLRNLSLQRARMNVVLGGRMREHLLACGVSADKVQIVDNWAVDAVAEPVSVAESALRTRLGLQGRFVVVYSGNLGRAHEYETFLGAAALLQHSRDVVFLMIGAGAGMPGLKRAVLQNGLDNFRFIGYQPQARLADSLAAGDVHLVSLLPSLEGLIVPSKFYGILAAARPALFVGDADGDIARVLRATDAGVPVSVGDSAGLAREIERLKRDPARRHAMGARGLEVYQRRFTKQQALDRWEGILTQQAARTPAVTPEVRVGDALPRAPSGQ